MMFAILCAAAQGLAVGAAAAAVMTKLIIVPRILQAFGLGKEKARFCGMTVCAGIASAAWIDSLGVQMDFGFSGAVVSGLFCGIYVGLLAMAAAEVLDIVPFLSTGRTLKGAMKYMLAAAIAGKAAGALAYFLDGRWMI